MRMKNRGQGATKAEGGRRKAECPSLSTIHDPRSTAFTLVELLVVIVIISMLVGLLMPALISARGRARITQCSNNQHELSLAITQYDLAKKRLPGYINQVHGTAVGWAPVLLPFLGRVDLWEDPNGWRSGTPLPAYLNQFVCPDDTPSVSYPLSYVVNAAIYDDNPAPSPGDFGDTLNSALCVFRDYYDGSGGAISLSDVNSPTRTVMISEKNIPIVSPSREWTETLPVSATPTQRAKFRKDFGFSWPNPIIHANVTVSNSLPPIHPGIVIVTFCDGHTESLSEDALCSVYSAVP